MYSQKGLGRTERRPTVGAVMIQNSSNDQPRNNQSRPNQQRVERPQRQFTRINMTPAQVLPHLLKLNLTNLKEAPKILTLPLYTTTPMPNVLTILTVLGMIPIIAGHLRTKSRT